MAVYRINTGRRRRRRERRLHRFLGLILGVVLAVVAVVGFFMWDNYKSGGAPKAIVVTGQAK